MAALHARAFPADRGWSAREFDGFLGDPLCFVTTRPHAFALVRAVADEAELLTICTDPEHRRTGLGRAVLVEAIREAATRGARRMFLEVEAEKHRRHRALRQARFLGIGPAPRLLRTGTPRGHDGA